MDSPLSLVSLETNGMSIEALYREISKSEYMKVRVVEPRIRGDIN